LRSGRTAGASALENGEQDAGDHEQRAEQVVEGTLLCG
jgi:hypothetical protein